MNTNHQHLKIREHERIEQPLAKGPAPRYGGSGMIETWLDFLWNNF